MRLSFRRNEKKRREKSCGSSDRKAPMKYNGSGKLINIYLHIFREAVESEAS
jgi:hypothetical protein